jgi:RNA polymerase sigma factor (sigma-70 family)
VTQLAVQSTRKMSASPVNPPRREHETLAELAKAAGGGDRAAFEAIHRRLAGGLYKQLLERLGGRRDIADDLSQRTWLGVWQSLQLGRYDPAKSAMTTFVYAVGYKIWLQHLRTASRTEQGESALAGLTDAALDPENEAALAELLEDVRSCLKEEGPQTVLSAEERGIVRASAQGASDRELARQLNVAVSTLNARKQAALEKIRRFLAQRGHRTKRGERDEGDVE